MFNMHSHNYCNCCLYRKSGLGFEVDKYSVSQQALITETLSLIGKIYVWKTCDLRLKMGNIPS